MLFGRDLFKTRAGLFQALLRAEPGPSGDDRFHNFPSQHFRQNLVTGRQHWKLTRGLRRPFFRACRTLKLANSEPKIYSEFAKLIHIHGKKNSVFPSTCRVSQL